MKNPTILLLAAGLVASPSLASAIPAPMSIADLEAKSDVVVDAKVTAVVCVGAPLVTAQKTTVSYRTTLATVKTYKGTAPATFHIEFTAVKWHTMPPIGGWKEPTHLVGEAGKYHLKLKTGPDVYGLVWHNGLSLTASGKGPLPNCAGGSSNTDGGSINQDAGGTGQDAGSAADAGSPADAAIDSGSAAADSGSTGADSAASDDTGKAATTDATGATDTTTSTDAGAAPSDPDTSGNKAPSPAKKGTDDGGCQASLQPASSPLVAWGLVFCLLVVVSQRRRV